MKTILVVLLVFISSVCSGQTPRIAEKDTPWKIVVAPKEEPGERLTVTGTVYGPDGTTPLKDVSVYVYHTDVKGYYSGETNDSSNPRLRGYMRTSADGRYEFNTIKPGPYPSAQVPAHIHYVVQAPGYKEKIFEIVFQGDPFINDRMRADTGNEDAVFSIRPLERAAQGGLRCVQDIRLKRQ